MTGAGYSAYHQGVEIHIGQWGLGRHSSAYDGELFALAGGAAAATSICNQNPYISSIFFLTDNVSAGQTILQTTAHPSQITSILFHKHLTTLFS